MIPFGRFFEVIIYCITGYILASLNLVHILSKIRTLSIAVFYRAYLGKIRNIFCDEPCLIKYIFILMLLREEIFIQRKILLIIW